MFSMHLGNFLAACGIFIPTVVMRRSALLGYFAHPGSVIRPREQHQQHELVLPVFSATWAGGHIPELVWPCASPEWIGWEFSGCCRSGVAAGADWFVHGQVTVEEARGSWSQLLQTSPVASVCDSDGLLYSGLFKLLLCVFNFCIIVVVFIRIRNF